MKGFSGSEANEGGRPLIISHLRILLCSCDKIFNDSLVKLVKKPKELESGVNVSTTTKGDRGQTLLFAVQEDKTGGLV